MLLEVFSLCVLCNLGSLWFVVYSLLLEVFSLCGLCNLECFLFVVYSLLFVGSIFPLRSLLLCELCAKQDSRSKGSISSIRSKGWKYFSCICFLVKKNFVSSCLRVSTSLRSLRETKTSCLCDFVLPCFKFFVPVKKIPHLITQLRKK